ncbi:MULTISPECIES: hypothetical protein [unclassified Streptomyces]|uniref:hypothetical protein n=1 Tax=unclassified Streptomyces TaxID=2593676 RepID=UPI0036FC0AFC
MTSYDTAPHVLHGRRGRAARLSGAELLLDTAGLRRRIPLAAIERVETGGAGDRVLTVVLRTDGTRPPPAYSLTARRAPQAAAFAQRVSAAGAAAGEWPPGGAPDAVREEPLKRGTRRPRSRWWWVVPTVYLAGFVALVAAGAGAGALFGWLVVPLLLAPAVVAVLGGAELVRQGRALRARGVVAQARLARTYALHGEDSGEGCVYLYVDGRGHAHEWRGRGSAAERVEILYDPDDPEVARLGRGAVGRMVQGVAFAAGVGGLLLFLAAMVLAPAVRALAG